MHFISSSPTVRFVSCIYYTNQADMQKTCFINYKVKLIWNLHDLKHSTVHWVSVSCVHIPPVTLQTGKSCQPKNGWSQGNLNLASITISQVIKPPEWALQQLFCTSQYHQPNKKNLKTNYHRPDQTGLEMKQILPPTPLRPSWIKCHGTENTFGSSSTTQVKATNLEATNLASLEQDKSQFPNFSLPL